MGRIYRVRYLGRKGMAAMLVMAVLGLAISGCNEPITTYQVTQSCLSGGEKVLILPFMDTRTFVDPNDPHKDDLGEHARDIFVAAMKENKVGATAEAITPPLPKQDRSLTNAEVAELGRRYGADLVVAGQIFSFTETRAASIPPRAGMFVRVVSSGDASLMFVGDHYQAAAVPGASGGREAQAKSVCVRLIDGICTTIAPPALAQGGVRVASERALASMAMRRKARTANNRSGHTVGNDSFLDPMPMPPPPLLGTSDNSTLNPDEWGKQEAPEVPAIADAGDDLYNLPYEDSIAAVPLPPPPLEELGVSEEEVAAASTPLPPEPPALSEAEAAALPEPALADTETTATTVAEKPASERERNDAEQAADGAEANVAVAAEQTGASETDPDIAKVEAFIAGAQAAGSEESAELVEEETTGTAEMADAAAEKAESAEADVAAAQPAAREEKYMAESAEPVQTVALVEKGESSAADADMSSAEFYKRWINSGYQADVNSEPVDVTGYYERTGDQLAADLFASEDPLLAESRVSSRPVLPEQATAQPAAAGESVAAGRVAMEALESELPDGPVISTPLVAEQPRAYRTVDLVLPEDPGSASVSSHAAMISTASSRSVPGAVRILLLPYHDRENPNNLIPNTGGGEVVTTLYGTQLSMDPGIQVLWDASGQTSHNRLIDREEALQLGRMAGADYVMRGQVVEFRRAQSVPSFYSVVISTAVLAAQIFFAELSGVDVATELYRVSDGACVMSRRDRAQQKYVVQAEKTVRRLAAGMASSITRVVREESPERMDPLIDTLVPVNFLTNLR